MWTPEYFVRLVELPTSVEGVTIPNSDGTFNIYINSVFCEERQRDILSHELRHIQKDHFYNDTIPIREIEREADGVEKEPEQLPNVFEHSAKVIPFFSSLEAYRNYMFAMQERYQKSAGRRKK